MSNRLLRDFAVTAGRSLAAGALLFRPQPQKQSVDFPEELFDRRLAELKADILAEFDVPDLLEPRIEAMETALHHQAETIEQLKARTEETEDNMRRLIAAVEKICERLSAPGFEGHMAVTMAQDAASLPVPKEYEAPQPFFRRMVRRGRQH